MRGIGRAEGPRSWRRGALDALSTEDFRAKIAHTLNDLGAMTAAARRARTEGAAEAETPEEPTPDEG